jgi:hypothetical protein
MHVTYLGRIGGLLVPPVLPLVRVGDVATNVWVIMREHATHAERHSMVSTPVHLTTVLRPLHSSQGGCLACRHRFLLPKSHPNIL